MLTLGIPHADVAWVGSQGCEELQVHPDPQDNNCMRRGAHSHCCNLFLFRCMDPPYSLMPDCRQVSLSEQIRSGAEGRCLLKERRDVFCERIISSDTDQMCSATGTSPNKANSEPYHT